MYSRGIVIMVAVLAMTGSMAGRAIAGDSDGDGVDDDYDVCNNTPAGTAVDAAGRPLGDMDGDCDTDLGDFNSFIACLNGPEAAPAGGCVGDASFDGDTDADLADFALFQNGFTGPLAPPGMVLIPAGEFLMGNSFADEGSWDEFPRHAVYVDAFYMDTYEVTNQRYADALNWAWVQGDLITVTSGVVYKYNGGTSYPYCSTTSASTGSPNYGEYSRITWNDSTFGVVAGKENHPMVVVSWYGAVAYANWRSGMQGKPLGYDLSTWICNWNSGYRLPTEAEWEKAARGGVAGHRFPWSDQDTIQHARCNYWSSTSYAYDTSPTRGVHPCWGVGNKPYTSPVGFFNGSLRYKVDFNWPGSPTSYQTASGANGYGLHDMAGNVWEWCNDWFRDTYYGSSPYNNPRGPALDTYRVLRVGSWDDNAPRCRVADRSATTPGLRDGEGGFRLVLHAP